MKKWEDLNPTDFAAELLSRNGKLQLMASFVAMLPIPGILLDGKSRIIHMNQRAEKNWKTTIKQCQGEVLTKAFELSDTDSRQWRAADRKTLSNNEATIGYSSFRGGKEREFVLRVPVILDNDTIIAALFVTLEGLKEQVP